MQAVTQVKNSKWASILAALAGIAPLIDSLKESQMLPPAISGGLAIFSILLSLLGGQQAGSAVKKM